MNIFEALHWEQWIQDNFAAELIESQKEILNSAKRFFEQLKHELKIHADAEEKYIYIPVT